MEVKRKLKPSEINANYGDLPQDINSYIKDSVMAKQPEIDLWDFMDTRPDKLYEEWAYEVGSDMTTKHEAKPITRRSDTTQGTQLNTTGVCMATATRR